MSVLNKLKHMISSLNRSERIQLGDFIKDSLVINNKYSSPLNTIPTVLTSLVFSFLPLDSHLKLSRTCNRLCEVGGIKKPTLITKPKFNTSWDKEIIMDEGVTQEQLNNLFSISVPKSLDLSGCAGITDFSMLGKVHRLNLWCTGVTDVSALGGVHTLNLFRCEDITDVSALGGVHTLKLICCKGITDVSDLGGVHTLNLSRCTGITDVSMLGGVHTLHLSQCYENYRCFCFGWGSYT